MSRRHEHLTLWAHLVSRHACVMSPDTSLADLKSQHEHEHTGPGTIRNHPQQTRDYDLGALGDNLMEAWSQ